MFKKTRSIRQGTSSWDLSQAAWKQTVMASVCTASSNILCWPIKPVSILISQSTFFKLKLFSVLVHTMSIRIYRLRTLSSGKSTQSPSSSSTTWARDTQSTILTSPRCRDGRRTTHRQDNHQRWDTLEQLMRMECLTVLAAMVTTTIIISMKVSKQVASLTAWRATFVASITKAPSSLAY